MKELIKDLEFLRDALSGPFVAQGQYVFTCEKVGPINHTEILNKTIDILGTISVVKIEPSIKLPQKDYELAFFRLVKTQAMASGFNYDKSDEEFNEFVYMTVENMLAMIDYNQVQKEYEQAKRAYEKRLQNNTGSNQ